MGKPWARLEIDFMYHPKVSNLSLSAGWLWLECKNYCDKWHTDGSIPMPEMKRFRRYAPKFVHELTHSAGQKHDGTAYAPLLEVHPDGYQMHDYLEHNDDREVVLARIEQADANRDKDRAYKAKGRAAKKAKRDAMSGSRPVDVRPDIGPDNRPDDLNLSGQKSGSIQNQNQKHTTRASDPPLDVWFAEFTAAYPESRRRGDQLALNAFIDAFRGESDPPALYRLMRDRLANHVASAQWADRQVIPSQAKWLSERRWVQTLPSSQARPGQQIATALSPAMAARLKERAEE